MTRVGLCGFKVGIVQEQIIEVEVISHVVNHFTQTLFFLKLNIVHAKAIDPSGPFCTPIYRAHCIGYAEIHMLPDRHSYQADCLLLILRNWSESKCQP